LKILETPESIQHEGTTDVLGKNNKHVLLELVYVISVSTVSMLASINPCDIQVPDEHLVFVQ
jgi:hypothetical protein